MIVEANAIVPPLNEWESFYVIVGSSAGALTGLQFVVIALIGEARAVQGMQEIRAFGSPTVVHFCMALFISAIASTPWPTLTSVAIAFAACGLMGGYYAVSTIWHARRQTSYKPDLEDWIWYIVLPIVAYAGLLIAAGILPSRHRPGLYLVAATSLLLLFIGIHNAWDTVTYITVKHLSPKSRGKP